MASCAISTTRVGNGARAAAATSARWSPRKVAAAKRRVMYGSMAQKLAERIKAEFKRPVKIEGLPTADWVLIDATDVIVHLFRPEVRSFYNLERMWAFGDAPTPPAMPTFTDED